MIDFFALWNNPWSEYSQAKWDMRRMLGDLGHGCESAVYTMSDFRHRGATIRSPNNKGLVRANANRETIGLKRAYYAVQNVAGLFDSTVELDRSGAATNTDTTISFFAYRKTSADGASHPLFTFWTHGHMAAKAGWTKVKPSDLVLDRPGDSFETRPTVIEWRGPVFKEPVWVDLLTGRVYEFPSEDMLVHSAGVTFVNVPVYDSPCVLTERTALRIGGPVYVGAEHLKAALCGFGFKAMANKSVRGRPLTVAGKTYARGIGVHPESAIGFRANGLVKAFDALVGIDDEFADYKTTKSRKAKAEFRVWADGRVVKSVTVMESQNPVELHVDLAGVREIVLETRTCAPWAASEAADTDWLDARFTVGQGGMLEAFDDPSLAAQLGILTPPAKKEPQFNGAEVWGVRPGHPVIFRVPVSGERPMRFSAFGLPDGVLFDAERGVLGGTAPAARGDYPIRVVAENSFGSAERIVTLKVGDTICLTPPMGWNSCNIWGPRFTGKHAMAAAKALDESGLADYGWAYINLDESWEMNNSEQNKDRPELRGAARDAQGMIVANPSFPDMKAMTDYIHSLGFKAGIYSSPGPTTCGGCEGSYGHEMQDATRWAEWGFDYVKYDWCSYGSIFKDESGWDTWEYMGQFMNERLPKPRPTRDMWAKPYRLMNECLRAQNRDIVYSFCQYGCGETEKWGREAGANCWRSWQDLKDGWTWMEYAIEGYVPNAEHWKYTGPGFWSDLDMMIVGLQRSFGSTHPTYLTPNEQYTHVSLWAMMCSPLLLGTDLERLDPFTKSLLTNPMVIAVSQDTLGKPARRIRHVDAESVWTRPLANGDVAVALVNRYPFAREVGVDFAELGIAGEWWVRDVWTHKCQGKCFARYIASVPAHGTILLRMRKADCSRCD